MEGELERDVRAAIEARKDLGADYEPALVESFMEKVDAAVEERVRAEVKRLKSADDSEWDPQTFAMASLGLGIPITAIAGGVGGIAGMGIAWGGIVAVNVFSTVAASWRRQRR